MEIAPEPQFVDGYRYPYLPPYTPEYARQPVQHAASELYDLNQAAKGRRAYLFR